jgi:hypothetical protein
MWGGMEGDRRGDKNGEDRRGEEKMGIEERKEMKRIDVERKGGG